jgi:hypothetical protein
MEDVDKKWERRKQWEIDGSCERSPIQATGLIVGGRYVISRRQGNYS